MRRRLGHGCGYLGAALLLLASSVGRAEEKEQQGPREVVMKSLETKLRVDGREIDSKGVFLRYRVEQTNGDWLWLVADRGTRGWAQRREVIPVDEAIAFFSSAVGREPQSARAYRMRGLAYYDRT